MTPRDLATSYTLRPYRPCKTRRDKLGAQFGMRRASCLGHERGRAARKGKPGGLCCIAYVRQKARILRLRRSLPSSESGTIAHVMRHFGLKYYSPSAFFAFGAVFGRESAVAFGAADFLAGADFGLWVGIAVF